MQGLQRDMIFFPMSHIEYFAHFYNMPYSLMEDGLYPLFIKTKANYGWTLSAAQTFDEIFFQLTRIYLDPHPEENLQEKFIQDAVENLETEGIYQAYYIFCFVLIILKLQRTIPSRIKYFMVALEEILSNEAAYTSDFFQWLYLNQHRECDMDFSPRPNVNLDQYSTEEWSEITHNFEEWRIEYLIRRYKRKSDKLYVLNTIEHAHIGTEFESNLPF